MRAPSHPTLLPLRRTLVGLAMACLPAAGAVAGAAPADERGAPAAVERASELVIAAMNFLGVPYLRGGNGAEGGFDCSGFTRHIFEIGLGLVLPRRVDDQAVAPDLVSVASADLRPGDLVFFNTLQRNFSHVGIYVGGGRFIHAPRSGSQVRLENMRLAYWAARFTGARRAAVVAASEPAEAAARAALALANP